MKKNLLLFCSVFSTGAVLFNPLSEGQSITAGIQNAATSHPVQWTVNPFEQKSFIENKGQFTVKSLNINSEVEYAVDQGQTVIYFHKNGLTYYFRERKTENKNEDEIVREAKIKSTLKPDEWLEFEKEERKIKINSDVVSMQWENANPAAQIIAEGQSVGYFSYTFIEDGKEKNINHIKGYGKLIYKNLYPNIDVEYIFHPQDGIKYSLILHPGAVLSQVKMKYDKKIALNNDGEIQIATKFGDIIDHAPQTFYKNNKESVESNFYVSGNTVSFHLKNSDKTKTVVIDPWIQTPTMANSNCVWECEHDGSGNVYIIGGDAPLLLQKYNSAGVWQWTYTTPWDTTNDGDWLGTMATDLAGNTYVTNGSIAALQKVNASSGMIYSVNGGAMDEYWNIAFNCDQTKLIIGGTRLNGFPSITGDGVIYDINASNGSVNDMVVVGKTINLTVFGFPVTDPNEVRTITSSRNARYYYMTLDSLGAIDQDFSVCPNSNSLLKINHAYNFNYKCENYRPNNGNAGICSIRANRYYVYTQNGATLHKRSLATGAILATVSIPGGISTAATGTSPTLYQVGNSGIDIDSCGNVYVGSGNAVVKYDSSLNFISSAATSFAVYDVSVSYNGEVIVAGATGTSASTSRTGYVQSINMSACNPMTLFCCDANVCPAGPFCTTDAPVNLTPSSAGGTWSGTGITNSSTGTFDPAVAGAGTWTITYDKGCGSSTITITVTCCGAQINPAGPFCTTDAPVTLTAAASGGTWSGTGITNSSTGTFDPSVAGGGSHSIIYTISGCGSDTVFIDVSVCAALSVCQEINGDLTVSNGSGPYTWDEWIPPTSTPINNQAECQACGYTWNFFVCLNGGFPVSTCDSPGEWSNFASGTTVTPPANDTLRVTDSYGNTLQINNVSSLPPCSGCALTASASSTNATCGLNNGTASVTASGTGPYTYAWQGGQTNSTATGLAAGTYSITVTGGGGCTATASTVVGGGGAPSVSVTTTAATCGGNNGSATANVTSGTTPYSYSWSGGQSNSTATGLAGGTCTVTVTDGAGCTATGSGNVNATGNPAVTTSSSSASCGSSNGSATANASGGTTPYTYLWSDSQTNSIATGLAAGNYSVTVTDGGGCTVSAPVTVNNTGGPSTNVAVSDNICNGGSSGSAAVAAVGGTTPYTYVWSNSQTNSNITGLNAGTYYVTVTDAANCSAFDSATVTEPAVILVSFTVVNATCGNSDGSITATAGGGAGNYTYLWDNGQSASTATALAAGNYNITVTDGNGCTKTGSSTVNQVGGVAISAGTITDVSCYGGSDGTISVNVSGGTPPYTYNWSNGSSTLIATGLAAGDYFVTVSDGAGCLGMDTFTVSEPATIAVSGNKTDATCGNSDGSAWVTATGGTPGYTYLWSNSSTGTIITNVAAGNYGVTVSDSKGCTAITTVAVNESGAPTLNIGSVTDVSCNGGNNGSININVTGGQIPYTFAWSNSAVTEDVSGLAAGNYSVTVTGNDGCKSILNATVTQPAAISLSATGVNATCATYGTAGAAASGGTSPYSYVWSNGQTGSTATGLLAGTYTVTLTDANNCTAADTAAVNQTGTVTATLAGDSEICSGTSSLLVAGGGGSYLWYNGTTDDSLTVNPVATAPYYVIAYVGTCADTAYFTVYVDPSPVVDAGDDTAVYIGESATLTGSVTGGTPPFSYSWKPGNEQQATISVSPVAGTYYTLSVTDAKGCTGKDSVFVDVLPCDAEIFIPNAFAPDCKCTDEKFRVFSDCIKTIQLFIYDRWGEKVWETEDIKKGWDGKYNDKPMDAAVYVFYLKYTTINDPDKEIIREGNINLIR